MSSLVSAWQNLFPVPVTSVAGHIGDVTLSNSDISGLGEMATINDAPDTLHQYARVQGAWQTISGGGGGNPFDQNLNTTDNVAFNSVNINGGITQIYGSGAASFANGATYIHNDGTTVFTVPTGNTFTINEPSYGGAITFFPQDPAAPPDYSYPRIHMDGSGDAGAVQFNFQGNPKYAFGVNSNAAFGVYSFILGLVQLACNSDGSVEIPYGVLKLNGGTLSSDGTNLYWNGSQIA